MQSPSWRRRTLAMLIAAVVCLGLVARGQAVQTEIPPTEVPVTEQPTTVPPTEVPATEAPTEVPPTEEPTEQPTEAPTEAPTESPTEAPTETPTEIPATPTADAQPPAPPAATSPPEIREAEVTCRHPGTGSATPDASPVATGDTGGWTLLICTIAVDARGMDGVQIRGTSSAPGWKVILVDEGAPNTPGLLNASNNLVSFEPDPDSPQVTVLLGYQRSCGALPSTSIAFEVSGSVDGAQRMAANAALVIQEPAGSIPVVSVAALWIDTERNPASTSIRVDWTDAPEACSWTLVVNLVDADADTWKLVRIDGPDEATATVAGTTVSVVVPPGEEADGTILLALVPVASDVQPIQAVQAEAFPWP